jgi:4-alpha-glucanotransferase
MAAKLSVCLIFHFDQRPGMDRESRENLWARCFSQILQHLVDNPHVMAGLVLSGELVESFAESHPEALDWIRRMVERGQVELLATALHEPVLSAVPERDGTAQIKMHISHLKKWFGVRSRGCWLPHLVWDPSVPRVMVGADVDWTVVNDKFIMDVGAEPDHVWGVYRTEREGNSMALLPIATELSEMIVEQPVVDVFQGLRRRSNQRHGGVLLAVPASRFGPQGRQNPEQCNGWLADFFEGLNRSLSTLPTVLPSQAVASWRVRGRIYLPSSAPSHVGVPWERHLARYEEANRLHKKMLHVSRQVANLAFAVRGKVATGARPDPSALVQAQRYLYRAQRADTYWHGQHAGIYDPAARALAYKDLLRAERVVLDALGTMQRIVVESADIDGDGIDEVRIRTPTSTVIIEPAQGGAVSEWSLFETAQNVGDVLTRISEPYHTGTLEQAMQATACTDTGQPERRRIPGSHPGFSMAEMRRSIKPEGRDRYPRLCFLDQFLGVDVTREQMQQGIYAEAGRFPEGAWQLVTAEAHDDEAASAILTQDVHVAEAGGEHRARLTKRYVLRREPVLEMRLEIDNRDHEALRTRLAVMLNLSLSADASQQQLVLPDHRTGIHRAGEVTSVESLRLEGPLASLRMDVSRAARLWHFPIQTVHQDGGIRKFAVQGVCLVFLWPIELWGKESDRVRIALTAIV